MSHLIEDKYPCIRMDHLSNMISKGWQCDNLYPCPWQGKDGTCFTCPGMLLHHPNQKFKCGWDTNLWSRSSVILWRLRSDTPDDPLVLNL